MKRAYRKHLVNVVCIVSRGKKLRTFRVSLYGSRAYLAMSRHAMLCNAEARDKLTRS